MSTSSPSAASEVTPLSEMPQGTMWPNQSMSVATLSATPCRERPRSIRTPIAAILRACGVFGSTHTPGHRS